MGDLVFKILMKKVVINKRATTTYLKENFTNLDTHMYKVSDIENSNQYMKVNMDSLKERGEQMDDLKTKLFEAYQVASDGEFVRYIKTKFRPIK